MRFQAPRTAIRRSLAGLCIFAIPGLLAMGCAEPEQVDKNLVRTIKWTEVVRQAAEQKRLIAGVVKPVEVSRLSFEVGGRVEKVRVHLGDRVKAGDVLAALDAEPFELKVRQAEAELAAARAVFKDRSQELARQQKLFADGWVAKARLDAAVADYDAARSRVRAMLAHLNLRKRDLKLAVLRAPFDGAISRKEVDPHEELASGQTILELSGARKLKVSLRVPPRLVNRLEIGAAVPVRFPSLPDVVLKGAITEIGTRAEQANAFPVTVALVEEAAGLRAGMTAEVAFSFEEASTKDALTVPMWSVLAGPGQDFFVFVYDKDSSTVRKVAIEFQNLRDNTVEIAGDVRPGDIIATAGVEFLSDGQQVHLMGAEAPYGDGV